MIADIAAYAAFAAVVEEGSLAAAARRLGSSKTAISRYLARLEGLAGVKLVNRTSRKLGITASGAELYDNCAPILRTMSDVDRMMRGMIGQPSGLLRIFAPPVLQASNLPALIARFVADHPDIRVDFRTGNEVPDPQRHPFDVYFFIGSTALAELEQIELARYRSVICGSPGYLARRGTPAAPADLAQHDCILQTQRPRPEIWTFEPDIEVFVRGRLDSNNAATALAALEQDLGLARLPIFLVNDQLREGRLVSVLDEFMPVGQPITLSYRHVRRMPGKQRLFLDFIRAAFQRDSMSWRPL